MEYQSGLTSQANAYGGQALGGLAGPIKVAEPPRTLASADGRLETLNGRLAQATDALATVCSQIGAMTPMSGGETKANAPSPIGAVHRLNDLADEANMKLSAIENYIASIQRALG